MENYKVMKKILLVILTICSLNSIFCQENNSINFTVKPLGNGRTNLSWTSNIKKPIQISLQRSLDSVSYFTTVYSPTNTNLKNYSFIDFYPISSREVFYRLLIIDKKSNLLFSKAYPRNYTLQGITSLKSSEENIITKPIKAIENTKNAQIKLAIDTSKAVIEKSITLHQNKSDKASDLVVFNGVKSNMPDTYIVKEDKKKKKKNNDEEGVAKEFNSKNKKERKAIIDEVIAKKLNATTKEDLKESNLSTESKSKISEKKEIKTKPKVEDDFAVTSNKKKKTVTQDSIKKEIKVQPNLEEEFVVTSSNKRNNLPDSTKPKASVKVEEKKANTFEAAVNTGIYGPPGKLNGKVINAKTGGVLSEANVTIKGGKTNISAKTDYNGLYSFSNIPSGYYTITVSYVGYKNKVINDVKVIKDDVVTQDITMSDTKSLDDVVVKSSNSKKTNIETVSALQVLQKNAASVSDGISAEAIKRTPDKNTSDIMKRISGASIQEDKFAIIRGLNDRYNAVFLNNAPLPSSESDRKAFAFDIFPSNMLDNLIITKTATPDMIGDFAGGVISINTKDIPTKDFQSFSFGVGYNTQATFQNRQYYKGGRWDWLGIDDGTRALSPNIPTSNLRNYSSLERAQFGKNFGNTWKIFDGSTPFNYNMQYARGYNIQKNNKDYIGVLIALTYNRSYNRTYGDRRGLFYDVNNIDTNITPQYTGMFIDETYSTQVLASAMANFTLKINETSKLSFKNLISVNSEDKVIARTGNVDLVQPELISLSTIRWFTSNTISSSQLNGEHFIKKSKVKINWTLGYSNVKREIPNRRISSKGYNINNPNIILSDIGSATQPSPDVGGAIFFSKLTESAKSAKIDIERNFRINNLNNINIKLGSYYQMRNRDFGARYLGVIYEPNSTTLGTFDDNLRSLTDEGKLFDAKNFGKLRNGKAGFQLSEDYRTTDSYDASSTLFANYAMMDARFFKFIRVIGGARIEYFNQKLNTIDFGTPIILDSKLTDVLPSLNLVFSLNSKQNLRFAYSKTLNRPEYRELAKFIYYDYTTRLSIEGDPTIERSLINNYDVRYEVFPGKGQMFSVSCFYKTINNPIELGFNPKIDGQAKYLNGDKAEIKGIEMEFRSNIGNLFKLSPNNFFNKITAFGNLAIIESKVSFDSALRVDLGNDRQLQGQSPYLVNGGLIYQNDMGWSSTIQFNQIGQRIFIAGNTQDANLWEHSRPVLDFQIAKTFEKHNLEFKLNIKDILAPQQVFFYDLNKNGKYDPDPNYKPSSTDVLNAKTDKIFSTANFGRVISASITYKF
jgi:TonB-dependent receptor